MKKNQLFTGCATALVTPFLSTGELDEPAMRRLIQRQISCGIDALVLLGTTGEPCSLSITERERVINIGREETRNKCPLIVGTGTNDTRKTIAYAKQAKELGADGQLIVTPYYNKTSQLGLIAHYEAVLDACNLPAILYHVPSRTGLGLSNDVLLNIMNHPNFAGLKDASGNIIQTAEIIEITEGHLPVYCGNDDLILPMIALGGCGAISVCSNVLPKETKTLVDACLFNQTDTARKLHYALSPLIRSLFLEVNPIPVKAALSMMGLIHEHLRMPLLPLDEYQKTKLKSILISMNQLMI